MSYKKCVEQLEESERRKKILVRSENDAEKKRSLRVFQKRISSENTQVEMEDALSGSGQFLTGICRG